MPRQSIQLVPAADLFQLRTGKDELVPLITVKLVCGKEFEQFRCGKRRLVNVFVHQQLQPIHDIQFFPVAFIVKKIIIVLQKFPPIPAVEFIAVGAVYPKPCICSEQIDPLFRSKRFEILRKKFLFQIHTLKTRSCLGCFPVWQGTFSYCFPVRGRSSGRSWKLHQDSTHSAGRYGNPPESDFR